MNSFVDNRLADRQKRPEETRTLKTIEDTETQMKLDKLMKLKREREAEAKILTLILAETQENESNRLLLSTVLSRKQIRTLETKVEESLRCLGGCCALCGVRSAAKCSGCKIVGYCGRDHQLLAWKRQGHKASCGKPVPTLDALMQMLPTAVANVLLEFGRTDVSLAHYCVARISAEIFAGSASASPRMQLLDEFVNATNAV